MQPLKGLTVVTLEHAIAAPFATRQLADLGAPPPPVARHRNVPHASRVARNPVEPMP